jgi:hypothetical protein
MLIACTKSLVIAAPVTETIADKIRRFQEPGMSASKCCRTLTGILLIDSSRARAGGDQGFESRIR